MGIWQFNELYIGQDSEKVAQTEKTYDKWFSKGSYTNPFLITAFAL